MTTEHNTLSITINGEEFVAPRPKLKVTRRVLKLQDQINDGAIDLNTLAGFDEYLKVLILLFDNEELTIEVFEEIEQDELIENLNLGTISGWISSANTQKKMQETQEVSKMREHQKSNTPQ
jgi:hypothetical protein